MAKPNIMVVDDEKNICELLRLYLEKEDFDVTIVNNGSDAIALIRQNQPSLVLLDIMMPVIDGWEVCRQVREFSSVPIIMLTAKGETFDKVMGLDLGADDYIVKPFDTKEVVARVKAVLRRSSSADTEGEVRYDKLTVNIVKYELCVDGKVIDTPPKELELLYHLAKNQNRVYTRDHLPHRRSSSSAPRRDSTEPRPRGCSVPGEPPQGLPSF